VKKEKEGGTGCFACSPRFAAGYRFTPWRGAYWVNHVTNNGLGEWKWRLFEEPNILSDEDYISGGKKAGDCGFAAYHIIHGTLDNPKGEESFIQRIFQAWRKDPMKAERLCVRLSYISSKFDEVVFKFDIEIDFSI
jgi:hypothetical protein